MFGFDGRKNIILKVIFEIVLGVIDALVLNIFDFPDELLLLIG